MTSTKPHPLRRALLLGAMVSLYAAPAAAQVVRDVPRQGQRDDGRVAPVRRTSTQWTFDLRATYSDNFRRIDDERTRSLVLRARDEAGELGDPFSVVVPNAPLSPPDGVIFTGSLRGASLYERPGLTGIVQGGVAVTINADDSSLDERLEDTPLTGTGIIPLPPGSGGGGLPIDLSGFDGEIVSQTFGLTREQELFVRPDIAASATARIVDQLFYVDVAGVAQQQVINQRQAIALETDGQLGDVTTFVGGSVSPYLSRQLGNSGTVEARYRLSAVVVADEQFEELEELDADGQPIPNQFAGEDRRFANDSLANEAILEYASNDFFDRFDVTLRASAARSDESGSDVLPEVELTRLTGEAALAYDLGRSLALTGTAGYDDVTLDQTRPGQADDVPGGAFDDSELSGFFWSVGGTYAPTRRSRFEASVGERFGGTQITGAISYRPTPRLSVSGRARRDLTTGTQDGLQGAIGLNSQTIQIVEQLSRIQSGSAQQLLDRVVGFRSGFSNIQQQAFGVQLNDTFDLSASYAARRTDFGLSVQFTDAEFGEDDQRRGNKRYSAQASVNRQVTRRLTAGLNARLERLEGVLPVEALGGQDPGDQTSDQYFLSATASYAIGPRLGLTARAYRAVSEGGAGNIGFGIAREYEENAVSAGIRWTF